VSDASEKPFEATPQRIEKAKREGNTARSSELAANLSFAAAAACVACMVPHIASATRSAIVAAASGAVPLSACLAVFCGALAVVASAAGAGTIAGLFQSGGLRIVMPSLKFERLNPVEGIKRILSRETLTHTLRAAFAFAIAAGAMLSAIAQAASQMVRAATPAAIGAIAWSAVEAVSFAACATGLLFAVAEHGAARTAWLRKLRMSFEERKREAKEQEGDPFARSRRRALHRALSRSAMARVKRASFVVVNPTHVAVALEYRPPEVPVPLVLVRAVDAAALRVRALAAQYDIPIVENVLLARALYQDARPDEPIPYEHYVAVAEVVAALMRRNEPAS
jgi:flagellar biosynthesis protein FlhB